MSFGFGVGDFIAVVNLLERVANELRNYRDAPFHFQQVSAELHLFHRALSRILKIESEDKEDRELLEQIRAIAIQCRQPLLSFIEKMRLKESISGLSNRGRTIALTTVGRRLHWSLIARKDVDELRQVVVAGMTAINMMLGMQQLRSLHHNHIHLDPEMDAFHAKSIKFYEDCAGLMNLPQDLAGLKMTVSHEASEQKHLTVTAVNQLNDLSSTSSALMRQNNYIVKSATTIQENLAKSVFTVIAIANDVKRILSMLGAFSQDLLAKVAANGQMLLGIHTVLKRLLRAVEAIPLHLTLGIVRLDDAIGESWALPYQACQTLASFKNILQVVVFGNNRPGARRVYLDKILLRLAKDGVVLNENNWYALIKQGSHVSQAMVLDQKRPSEKECPFPDCHGLIELKTGQCTACGKQSSFQIIDDQLGLKATRIPWNPELAAMLPRQRHPRSFGPMRVDEIDLDNEYSLFRNVHYRETSEPITSIHETVGILQKAPEDPRALRYQASWRLSQDQFLDRDSLLATVAILKRAVQIESDNMEGWYLLGRASLVLTQLELSYQNGYEAYQNGYEAYQEAVYCNPHCAPLWTSIGILFFQVNQARDCLGCFSRSIRLHPYDDLVWRNLGVLYDNCNQIYDALDAYERALDLDDVHDDCRLRVEELRFCMQNGVESTLCTIGMEDFDLEKALDYHNQQAFVESEAIPIAPVQADALNTSSNEQGPKEIYSGR